MERIWELRENLSAHDAAYAALAEALEAPLITMDARLAQAPCIRAAVEVYRWTTRLQIGSPGSCPSLALQQ